MLRKVLLIVVLMSGLVLNSSGLGFAADQPSASQFDAAMDFVEKNLIGRTLELKTGAKIAGGSLETEFIRRIKFLNLVRSKDAATFDEIGLIKQKIWDLDKDGKRINEMPRVEDRQLVLRIGIRESKATGELIGASEVLTSSYMRPTGAGTAVRMWFKNDRLFLEQTTPLYSDFFAKGGAFKPGASIVLTEFFVKDGKVHSSFVEKAFDVNSKTLERTQSGPDVSSSEVEIEGLF